MDDDPHPLVKALETLVNQIRNKIGSVGSTVELASLSAALECHAKALISQNIEAGEGELCAQVKAMRFPRRLLGFYPMFNFFKVETMAIVTKDVMLGIIKYHSAHPLFFV